MATTSAGEWREKRKRGIEFELPQWGDTILMRPMDVEFFFRSGNIPDFIAPTVRKIINGMDYQMPYPPDEQSDEDTVKWLEWLDKLVAYAFVLPKVVDDPQGANEIAVDEIDYADKLHIYRFFGRPAQVLRSFRLPQANDVATVDAAKNNGAATKQDARSQAVGQPVPGNA